MYIDIGASDGGGTDPKRCDCTGNGWTPLNCSWRSVSEITYLWRRLRGLVTAPPFIWRGFFVPPLASPSTNTNFAFDSHRRWNAWLMELRA